MSTDSLSARMKAYEHDLTYRFSAGLPVILRLDGRGFSRWITGLKRPFDERLAQMMQATTRYLVQTTGAVCGYTQSDEISLILYSTSERQPIYFDGKREKITSLTAVEASLFFEKHKQTVDFPEFQQQKTAMFDCRSFQVPTPTEAINYLIWREQHAVKNSIATVARHYFPLEALYHKSGLQMKAMLRSKEVCWEHFSLHHRYGSYFQRRAFEQTFSEEERQHLPPQHHARTHPAATYTRYRVVNLNLERLQDLHNAESVIFEKGAI